MAETVKTDTHTFSAELTPRTNAAVRSNSRRPRGTRRRGSVLIVTVLVVMALAYTVLVLSRAMTVEAVAAANGAASVQASMVERGAEQYLLAAIVDQGTSVLQLQEDDLGAQPVGDGYFWVLRPPYPNDDDLPLFGLVDENAKVDLNYATYNQLLMLPNMPDDAALSALTWRGATSLGGVIGSDYKQLTPAYSLKGDLFETVEEFLMVRGVTHELLYGQPQVASTTNNKSLSNNSGSAMNSMYGDKWVERGISDLLTIYSGAPKTGPSGAALVNIGGPGNAPKDRLRTLMTSQSVNASEANVVLSNFGNSAINDIFELISIGKMSPPEFAKIADYVTTANVPANQPLLRGRINVNTAPREVLKALGNGLNDEQVDSLVSQRGQSANVNSTSIGWVATALGNGAAALQLGNQITGTTSRYSADILAVSGNGRAYKRVKVVIDASTAESPRIIYRRDLTYRGWPLDKQVLTSLRTGRGVGEWRSGVLTSTGGTFR